MRRLAPLLTLLPLALAVGPAHATAGLAPDEVRRRLDALEARPGAADAEARWLVLERSLDVLPPAEQAARAARLARRAAPGPLSARVAAFRAAFLPAEEARAEAARLGFLARWAVLGPRAAAPGAVEAAHAELAALPPPGAPGAADGLYGPVSWEPLADGGPPGGVSLDHLAPGGVPSAVHLAVRLEVPRRTEAVLRLGAAGDVAVGLDGALLGVARGLAFGVPDQLAAPVVLEPGPHVLVLTVATDGSRRPLVYARLTDARGRPLPDLVASLPAGTAPPPGPAAEAPSAPRLLPAVAPGGPDLAGALRAAAARRALGLPDAEGAPAELLEDLLLTDDAAALPAPELLLALAHVRQAEARASVLLHLASSGRDDPPLRVALAELAATRAQPVRATLLLDGLPPGAAADPATRALVERAAGRPGRAWRLLAEAAAGPDASERLLVEAARAAGELARPDLALDPLRRLAGAMPGELSHGSSLADTLSALARPDEAAATLRRLAARRPDLPGLALEAARLLVAAGREVEAREAVDEQVARAGVGVDTLSAAGQLLEDLGDAEAAAAVLRRALALRPGDPDIRAALERVQPASDEVLPFEIAVDAALLARPSRGEDAPFEVLAEEIHLEVRADGGYRRYEQRILRVHRVPDDREDRTSVVRFDPSREQVRVLSAHVWRDGLALPVTEREVRQVTEDWYGMYYDLRALAVPFDDLRPGDVIALRERVDGAPSAALPGSFGLLELLQERLVKQELRVTLVSAAALPLHARLHVPERARLAGARVAEAEDVLPDGRVRRRLVALDLPPLPAEPLMPGAAEVGALYQVTTFASWDALEAAYQGLVEPQRVVTPAMRRWVEERVAAATAPDGTVARARLLETLVEDATREIRYVGLEFGVHGYKPYRTDQVWTRRFGDCKDQATLMTTLLGLAGIPAHVVLLRTRPLGRVPDPLPSLALFDHAVVYLPERGQVVDPTTRWFGLGDLPDADQGAQALVLGLRRGVERVPPDPPSRNGIDGFYTLVLAPDGSARVEGAVVFRGIHAADYRERLSEADARADRLEKLLNGRYPGLRLLAWDLGGLEDRGAPLRLSFEGEAPRVAAPSGDGLEVARPAGGDGHAARLAGPGRRTVPLVSGPPVSNHFRFRYVLPVGWAPRGPLVDAAAVGPFGRWSVRWLVEEGAVTSEAELTVAADQVEPADYPAFRELLQAFDAAVRPPLEVGPRPVAARAAP